MVINMAKCKITVLKRIFHEDLVNEYYQEQKGLCDVFKDGQEFITDSAIKKSDLVQSLNFIT